MRIILKHTVKNIFKKPLRTLLVVFCVMICSLSALLCFDMSGALNGMFKNLYGQYMGTMDVLITGTNIDEGLLTDIQMPDSKRVPISMTTNSFTHDLDDQYTYFEQDTLNILGFDLAEASQMGMIPFSNNLKANEVVLSMDFAKKYSYSEGDTIVLHDENKGEHEYRIVEVVDSHGKGLAAKNTAILSNEGISSLISGSKISQVAMDVKNDAEVSAAVDYIKANYPNLEAESPFDSEDLNLVIDRMTKLFFVLFAICVLMVIFVTISISERIISERMSVVGTFRSLGLSTGLTTTILLFENALYGLIGSSFGCLCYAALRTVLFKSMMVATDTNGNAIELKIGSISPLVILTVIASAVLVECICPIKEVIKAVKTPIRDIIFLNKDTEYKANRITTIIGILCAVASLVLSFLPTGFFQRIIQFALMTVALSLLFPHVLRFISKILARLFDKRGMPVAKLAITEVYTKKSTVGSSVLITTAVALSIVVYTVATSLSGMIDTGFFSGELYIETNISQKTAYFSFIKDLDNVKDVEYIYKKIDDLRINGADASDIEILSVDENGYDWFSGIPDVPVLAENEISISSILADKYDLRTGDQVTIEFQIESYYPINKTFTISHLSNTIRYDATGSTIVLNENIVKDLYGDYPGIIMVHTDKPSEVDSLVEKYAKGAFSSCYSNAEYDAQASSKSAGILSIVKASVVMGIALTFIGSVSNLLIGFEGRKRECAILLSTSLSKKQLARLFFLESLFSSAIALLAAIPMGIIMQKPVFEALSAISANIEVTTGAGAYFLFVLALWILFILTSGFPIRASRKMKLSEQLKYE